MNDDRYNFQFLSVLSALMWVGALALFKWVRLEWTTNSSDASMFLFVLIVYLVISLFFTSLTVRAHKKLHRSKGD